MDLPHLTNTDVVPDEPLTPEEAALQAKRRRIFRRIVITLSTLVVLLVVIGPLTPHPPLLARGAQSCDWLPPRPTRPPPEHRGLAPATRRFHLCPRPLRPRHHP